MMGAMSSADAQYNAEMASYQNSLARWEIEKRQLDERQKMMDANAILQMQQLTMRQQEVNDAAVTEKSEIAMAALRAKEAAKLAAGEANVSGRSTDHILSAIEAEAQRRTGNVEATRQNQIMAAQTAKMNVKQESYTAPIYGILGSAPDYDSSGIFAAALSGLGSL